ncbi:MAG: hypothetical protein R3A10_04350 [Caldilineaceae bacterium]
MTMRAGGSNSSARTTSPSTSTAGAWPIWAATCVITADLWLEPGGLIVLVRNDDAPERRRDELSAHRRQSGQRRRRTHPARSQRSGSRPGGLGRTRRRARHRRRVHAASPRRPQEIATVLWPGSADDAGSPGGVRPPPATATPASTPTPTTTPTDVVTPTPTTLPSWSPNTRPTAAGQARRSDDRPGGSVQWRR